MENFGLIGSFLKKLDFMLFICLVLFERDVVFVDINLLFINLNWLYLY